MIGIKFIQDVPQNIPKLSYSDKHCHFIGKVRDNKAFYIQKDNISCPLARFYLGIEAIDIKELSDILVGWNDAINKEIGINYLREAIRIKNVKDYIIYFNYPNPDIKPDVIIKIANPDVIQSIVQRYSAASGKRIRASLSGIGAACGECTALPFVTQSSNVSVGCNGSRPGINLKQDELLLAAPFNSKIIEMML
ncbi:MAG: DUF169 domain-containing protein [bacterium]